ncbi:MAG TPA: hypothetical protein VF843_04935 [Streptosporangiaceae bacterium]
MSGQPAHRRRWGSCLLTVLLVIGAAGGVVLAFAGAAGALYANSPANREGNSFAGAGIIAGGGLCVLGIAVTVGCGVGVALIGRRNR